MNKAQFEKQIAVERWLRDEVVPVYDAMQADPRRGLSAEQVLEAVRARSSVRDWSERGPRSR